MPIVFLRDIYKRSVSIKVTDQNLGSRLSKIASKLNNAKKKKNLWWKESFYKMQDSFLIREKW